MNKVHTTKLRKMNIPNRFSGFSGYSWSKKLHFLKTRINHRISILTLILQLYNSTGHFSRGTIYFHVNILLLNSNLTSASWSSCRWDSKSYSNKLETFYANSQLGVGLHYSSFTLNTNLPWLTNKLKPSRNHWLKK